MSVSYETSIAIKADAGKVWAVLVDVDRWAEWTESVTSARRLDQGPLVVGSQASIRQPRLRPAVWTVTTLEPGTSFAWASRNPGVITVGGHRIAPNPDGTVEFTLTIDHRGPLASLIWLLTGSLTRRYLQTEATGLKHRVEHSS